MFRDSPRILAMVCCLFLPLLARGQGVIGVVRDVKGSGIGNIAVHASVSNPADSVVFDETTDPLGRFIFPDRAGSWWVSLSASDLNAQGYLSVGSAYFPLTNREVNLRFTTRKLDLSRQVSGVVSNELGWPLAGVQIRASIEENRQTYQTNLVTDAEGRFWFGASPAVWRLFMSLPSSSDSRLFPMASVSVERTNAEVQVALVAPAATSSISGVATNLAGLEVVAECEAYGQRYVRTAPISSPSETFTLPVFPGVWRVYVTNVYFSWLEERPLPPPVMVSVTNQAALVHFTVPTNRTTLVVAVVLADGTPATHPSVQAIGLRGYVVGGVFPIATPLPEDPSIHTLSLEAGRWMIEASSSDPDSSVGWRVSREIFIAEGEVKHLTLVIPDEAMEPRIIGNVRDSSGRPLAGSGVSFRSSEVATNYSTSVLTGFEGNFSVAVPPGRWWVALESFGPCLPAVLVTVTNTNVPVELIACPLPVHGRAPIAVQLVEDVEPPGAGLRIDFLNWGYFEGTNGAVGDTVFPSVTQGLMNAIVSPDWNHQQQDPFRLLPNLKFHHRGHAGEPTVLTMVARQATARIEGRLRDPSGKLLAGGYVSAWANLDGTNYAVGGSVASGYYSLNVIPGEWEVAASTWRPPDTGIIGTILSFDPSTLSLNYADPPRRLVQVTNGVMDCDFVLHPHPPLVPLRISIVREDGSAVHGVIATSTGEPVPTSPYGSGSGDGTVVLNVVPGTNVVSAGWSWLVVDWENLLLPSVVVNVPATGSNHVVLVARTPTACVPGTISDPSGQSLPLPVKGSLVINGTNYSSYACPSFTNEFCLPVVPGNWEVGASGDLPNLLGYGSAQPVSITVPSIGSPDPVHLELQPFVGDFRFGRLTNPEQLPGGVVQFELRGQADLTWRIEHSVDLVNWKTLSTVATTNGVAHITSTTSGPKFFRALWVR